MKRLSLFGFVCLLMLALAACGGQGASGQTGNSGDGQTEQGISDNGNGQSGEGDAAHDGEDDESDESRSIEYLGETYTLPGKVERIVITGAVESMEDALVLDVKPVGAMTSGGQFDPLFASITADAVGIGEKTQPDIEAIIKLQPDVILASTKFPAETLEKLQKVQTTIPVSHISSDWEANLNLLAELTGKEEEARTALRTYAEEIAAAKQSLEPVFADKVVLVARIRAGNIAIYPEDVFFNPSVYAELGAAVPDEVQQAQAQQLISLEMLSQINPDYLFIQFSEQENAESPKALEDLQSNPIWNSLNAVKTGNLFVNLVDPGLQGGTAYSKMAFLEAIKNSELIQDQ